MSNIIVTCSLLLVLCEIGAIFALPTDGNVYNFFPIEVYRGRNTNRALSDLATAKKCTGKELGLYVPPGVKFFWSGFGVSNSDLAAAEIAQYVAKQEGKKCWTLESVLELKENKHIQTCTWAVDNPACAQFWHDLSCEYAKKSRGDIRFILGPNVRPTSSWLQVESGQIRDNQQSGQDVYNFKKYDLYMIYCQQMANYPTKYPDVKNDICA